MIPGGQNIDIEKLKVGMDAAVQQVKNPRGPRIAPRHVEKTPGRNEPCSCGSGLKFKRCCGG